MRIWLNTEYIWKQLIVLPLLSQSTINPLLSTKSLPQLQSGLHVAFGNALHTANRGSQGKTKHWGTGAGHLSVGGGFRGGH